MKAAHQWREGRRPLLGPAAHGGLVAAARVLVRVAAAVVEDGVVGAVHLVEVELAGEVPVRLLPVLRDEVRLRHEGQRGESTRARRARLVSARAANDRVPLLAPPPTRGSNRCRTRRWARRRHGPCPLGTDSGCTWALGERPAAVERRAAPPHHSPPSPPTARFESDPYGGSFTGHGALTSNDVRISC